MTSGNFDGKISINIHIQQWLRMDHTPGAGNRITVITGRSILTHFDVLTTKRCWLFYDFLIRHLENIKSNMFLIRKKRKIRILEQLYCCSTKGVWYLNGWTPWNSHLLGLTLSTRFLTPPFGKPHPVISTIFSAPSLKVLSSRHMRHYMRCEGLWTKCGKVNSKKNFWIRTIGIWTPDILWIRQRHGSV